MHDHALAESAVAAPQSGFGGHYLHGELFEMASAYLFHLVQNHPFLDGKKRVGTATALTFMELIGVETKIPNQVLKDMMTHPPSPNQGETDNPPSQHSSNNTSNRSHPASPILPPPPLHRRALGLCQRRHLLYPGGLGVQDGGNLLLLKAFAYPDVTGITFVLLWRFRELIGIGLPALAVAGRGLSIPREDSAS